MLKIVDKERMTEKQAKEKYPNCKYVMVQSTEGEKEISGILVAVSTDPSSFNEMAEYVGSLPEEEIGLPFFGGSYNIPNCSTSLYFYRA